MLTDDSEFLEMLRYSHTVASTVDLYTANVLVKADIPIVDGSVTATRKANARRSFDLTIGLHDWETLDIDCYKSRVKINIGIELIPGVRRTLPQGFFRVDGVQRSVLGDLQVSGTSLESYVIDDRFFTPRTPPKGSGTIASIQALIVESMPDATFTVTATKDKVVGMTAPWERERWEAVTALADSIDAEVFCAPTGLFVIQDKVDFGNTDVQAVWTVDAGPDGVLVSLTENHTRNQVYNAVVASGQSSDQDVPPVWDVATDNNPASPTWWGGPFGHVTRFYANPNFTSKDQCTAAAQNLLAESIAENCEVNFGMLPNPGLEPGDAIRVRTLNRTTRVHAIDELTIPLGLGSFSAKTLLMKNITQG
jgi:Domain of unknown function (DUF5047)